MGSHTGECEITMTKKKEEQTHGPAELTSSGFIKRVHRLHSNNLDKPRYAFLLGSGASVSSGIPSAKTLAEQWLNEMYEERKEADETRSRNEWVKDFLQIEDFNPDDLAQHYSDIYTHHFSAAPEEGYAALESAMDDVDPSVGYSMLAQFLETTEHNVVITTNFDHMTEMALFTFTNTWPQICGHASLAVFSNPKRTRPLILKIHHDLLLNPQNTPEETEKLHENWAKPLRGIFKAFTPIVIGYGGNDKSLMEFLETLEPGAIAGGIYWCYRPGDGKPADRILELIRKHQGKHEKNPKGGLVQIQGFDHLMIQLGNQFGFRFLHDEIVEKAKTRAAKYQTQREKFEKEIKEATTAPPASALNQETTDTAPDENESIQEAFAAISERTRDWWTWEQRVRKETDPDKKDALYQQGLKEFPNSLELNGNYALFLKNIRKDYDRAEKYYQKALEIEPDDARVNGNYALFLENIRKDYDRAEKYYQKALEIEPDDARVNGNYALFLENIRKDYDRAEKYYQKALEIEPDDANNNGNYANFLLSQGRLEEAQERLRKAWQHCSDEGQEQLGAELSFYEVVVARLQGQQKEETVTLGKLKFLFAKNFERSPWDLSGVLDRMRAEGVPEEEMEFYETLAAAVSDETQVDKLEEFPKWQKVKPVPVS